MLVQKVAWQDHHLQIDLLFTFLMVKVLSQVRCELNAEELIFQLPDCVQNGLFDDDFGIAAKSCTDVSFVNDGSEHKRSEGGASVEHRGEGTCSVFVSCSWPYHNLTGSWLDSLNVCATHP